MDESTLRRKAREAIQAGKLPSRRAESTWGGPGVGTHCAICDKPVKRDEVEFELEFARDDDPGLDTYHLHIRCFAAWEFERQNFPQNFPMPSSDRTGSASRPWLAGGASPSNSAATAMSSRVLPEASNDGTIVSCECNPGYRRGPA